MTKLSSRFWEEKTLAEMSPAQWEALCDGCGRCCLVLLIDEDTGETHETNVACRLFDAKTRSCTDYAARHRRVPDCVRLTPTNAGALEWMPETCAYRRLARGEPLPDWHYLLSGDRERVAKVGVAVRDDLENEHGVAEDELENRLTGVRRC